MSPPDADSGAAPAPALSDPDGPDSVRMPWNSWPRSKLEASRCVVPLAASLSPLRRPSPSLPAVLPYSPLRCKPPCSALLNPFARVDFHAKIWICPFCLSRNQFPPHYNAISDSNVPGELYPLCSTVEYAPPTLDPPSKAPPPVFLFVIDTCVIEEELEFVKSALRRAVGLLPEHALVGLVAFGTQVQLYELGFQDVSKIYAFRGVKEISKEQLLDQVGIAGPGPGYGKGSAGGGVHSSPSVRRFLLPASECDYVFSTVRIWQLDFWWCRILVIVV